MHRFLDACTSCQKVSDSGGGPAGRRIAKRVFTRDGEEVTDVHDLVYDQDIWLSYGEDFKPPHGNNLTLLKEKYLVRVIVLVLFSISMILRTLGHLSLTNSHLFKLFQVLLITYQIS